MICFGCTAELSFDARDAEDDIDAVDILERLLDSWLKPRVPDDSVISEDVEEEEESGRGSMYALSDCVDPCCNNI